MRDYNSHSWIDITIIRHSKRTKNNVHASPSAVSRLKIHKRPELFNHEAVFSVMRDLSSADITQTMSMCIPRRKMHCALWNMHPISILMLKLILFYYAFAFFIICIWSTHLLICNFFVEISTEPLLGPFEQEVPNALSTPNDTNNKDVK